MPHRRILCIWFPRLGAERLLRLEQQMAEAPFAVVHDHAQRQVLWSLSPAANAMGLQRGQLLRDAQAMCPALRTRRRNLHAERRFLRTLGRWAGKFSPWVALEDPDSLMLDITGCAHLFGGEGALSDQIITECTAIGLSAQIGLADTKGAAWALAHYGKGSTAHDRSGDAIDQEARARPAHARPNATACPRICGHRAPGKRPTPIILPLLAAFIAPCASCLWPHCGSPRL